MTTASKPVATCLLRTHFVDKLWDFYVCRWVILTDSMCNFVTGFSIQSNVQRQFFFEMTANFGRRKYDGHPKREKKNQPKCYVLLLVTLKMVVISCCVYKCDKTRSRRNILKHYFLKKRHRETLNGKKQLSLPPCLFTSYHARQLAWSKSARDYFVIYTIYYRNANKYK